MVVVFPVPGGPCQQCIPAEFIKLLIASCCEGFNFLDSATASGKSTESAGLFTSPFNKETITDRLGFLSLTVRPDDFISTGATFFLQWSYAIFIDKVNELSIGCCATYFCNSYIFTRCHSSCITRNPKI